MLITVTRYHCLGFQGVKMKKIIFTVLIFLTLYILHAIMLLCYFDNHVYTLLFIVTLCLLLALCVIFIKGKKLLLLLIIPAFFLQYNSLGVMATHYICSSQASDWRCVAN